MIYLDLQKNILYGCETEFWMRDIDTFRSLITNGKQLP